MLNGFAICSLMCLSWILALLCHEPARIHKAFLALKSEDICHGPTVSKYVQSTLSTVKLSLLPGLHLLPINVVVYDGSNGEI